MANGKLTFLNISQLKRCFALLWKAEIPACVIGGVGSGKTTAAIEFVDDLNRNNGKSKYHLWKVILSVLAPEDFGVPYPLDGKLAHLAPTFLPFDCDHKGIILADEFDRAKPDTQNSFLQMLLGRELHGHSLSSNAYIIMTMNGESDVYTTPLSKAARTRVCTLFVSPHAAGNLESWDTWAEQNQVNDLIRGFARFRTDLIEAHEQFEELAVPTPRTRDMAGKILDAAAAVKFETGDILLSCLAGVLGKAAATELIGYKELFEKCPDPDAIIKNPEKAPMPEKSHILYAVALALCSRIEKGAKDSKTAEQIIKYAIRMPDELAAFTMKKVFDKCDAIVQMPEFMKWTEEHKLILL